MPPRISVFPKCFFDELTTGRMSFAGWIRDAAALGGEGVEHYDGFFRSLDARRRCERLRRRCYKRQQLALKGVATLRD